MFRLRSWGIVFALFLAAILLDIYLPQAVPLVFLAIPIVMGVAIKMESEELKKRNIDISKGSSLGNKLALILGVIIAIGVVWGIYSLIRDFPR